MAFNITQIQLTLQTVPNQANRYTPDSKYYSSGGIKNPSFTSKKTRVAENSRTIDHARNTYKHTCRRTFESSSNNHVTDLLEEVADRLKEVPGNQSKLVLVL